MDGIQGIGANGEGLAGAGAPLGRRASKGRCTAYMFSTVEETMDYWVAEV